MADHVVVYVDRLITASAFSSASSPTGASSSPLVSKQEKDGQSGEEKGPKFVECRICQEEDVDKSMEIPCACSGSMKYAHRSCVQRWCNEKGDTTCEICQQPYKPGYTVAQQRARSNGIPVDLRGNWEFNDQGLIAMAAAERHLLEGDYDEYSAANSSCGACCRSSILILMAFLLLRHALALSAAAGDEDFSTFCTLFLLRAAGFLLPCYIMARAMNILQRRRQRQEAAVTAAEVAFLLEAGRAPGLRFAARSLPSNQ